MIDLLKSIMEGLLAADLNETKQCSVLSSLNFGRILPT